MKRMLFPILILLIGCSDKKSEPQKTVTNLETNWTDFNTQDSIPELLSLTLKKVLKSSFEIANPNENFNATDVIINDSIPTRQLRLLSRKNNFWRIAYVQGGFGEYYFYAECKILMDSITDFKISQTNLKLENNDSIDKYIAEKRMELKDVKIKMQ